MYFFIKLFVFFVLLVVIIIIVSFLWLKKKNKEVEEFEQFEEKLDVNSEGKEKIILGKYKGVLSENSEVSEFNVDMEVLDLYYFWLEKQLSIIESI